MLAQISENPVFLAGGAFVLGWILGAIIGGRHRASSRDPRDNRIRSMEAELRIAQTNAEEKEARIASLEEQVEQDAEEVAKRENVISHQQQKVEDLKKDLMDSVKKTRELRHELTNRAAENVKSEVKLREVETELSVVHASTDMLATGVLEYSEAPNDAERPSGQKPTAAAKVSKPPR